MASPRRLGAALKGVATALTGTAARLARRPRPPVPPPTKPTPGPGPDPSLDDQNDRLVGPPAGGSPTLRSTPDPQPAPTAPLPSTYPGDQRLVGPGGDLGPPAGPPPPAYPGDYPGCPDIVYAPQADRDADPGEVVWAWVPYEEDHRQGKTRPVLIIGYDQSWLLGVFLSSTDHDRDAGQEASQGRHWVRVGRGAWDRRGRRSFARVDRIVRIAPASLSGKADRLDQARFERVATGIRRHWAD